MLFSVTVLVGTACGARRAAPESPPSPLPVAVTVSADVTAAVGAEDRFGLDLLTSGSQAGNLVVSPTSVAIALQMVTAGAAGTTATEMADVLHLSNAASAATTARQLLNSLANVAADQRNTLRLANTVWAQQNMPVKPAYGTTLRNQFDSTMRQADFQQSPDQAVDQINRAVADQTNGMIPHLFPAGTLNHRTRMVLTNAIYLAASWASAFEPKLTAPGPFTTTDGSVKQVPMMHQNTDPNPDQPPAFGYAAGPGYQVVTLPYTGGKLAFTVLLPSGNSLTPMVNELRANGLPSALRAVRPAQLDLSMPKFTVTSNLDLKGTLGKLGMPTAFTDSADFSGITSAEHLKIQAVQHDAVVQVDEHGTTAAAATGVGMQATALVARTAVVVDRPFLFLVTDTKTGAPLFLGRVVNPGQ